VPRREARSTIGARVSESPAAKSASAKSRRYRTAAGRGERVQRLGELGAGRESSAGRDDFRESGSKP